MHRGMLVISPAIPRSMPGCQTSQVICRQPGRYLGWPTVARGGCGTIYAVFCGDRDAHVCPFGKIFLVSSNDEGITWTRPRLVVDTPLDERDAGICVCRDGTVIVSFWSSHFADYRPFFERFYRDAGGRADRWKDWETAAAAVGPAEIRRWAPSYETPDHPDHPKRWTGFWTIRSRDGGITWDQPALSPVYSPHGPMELPCGGLLYVGMRALTILDGSENIGVARSDDQGRSWKMISRISSSPAYRGRLPDGFCRLGEPHATLTASGKIIAMARYEEKRDPENPEPSRLWQFVSSDGGCSWSRPRSTDIVGKPPHLATLRDGRILATYGYRHEPYGQRACLSEDEGETWLYDSEIILRDDAPDGDLGYASSVECGDGSLLSVYYQTVSPGGLPSLFATRTEWAPGVPAGGRKRRPGGISCTEADRFTL